MAKIFVDNIEYEVKDNKNLLDACISLGLNLPYFCWHPAMGSVGACRQCAVTRFKDENDTRGRLVMACMEPVTDGTRISIKHTEAVEMRAGVIEWLMTNHPHDCPVCDEGGECHLQDMTLMSGHNYRRHRYKKRTYHNQYLGPFINHEMNRCIQCYRCVRFYRDFAGGTDFDVFGIHNIVYFGRHEEGVLENEFSGNLVEVCPTGVFTDKTLQQHYTRKWDLRNAPSVCHHCGVGCNILAGERYGSLRRILTRYNGEVNGYFLCDRGRFGYEFVNHEKRIKNVYKKENGTLQLSDSNEALRKIKEAFSSTKKIVGIGSPKASLEANFALQKLVGKENFYHGISKKAKELISLQLEILRTIPVRTPSLRDIEKCDAVLVLGEDVTNTAPMIALALNQSVRQQPLARAEKLHIPRWNDAAARELIQDEKGPLIVAAPYATKLDRIASQTFRLAPADIARLGFAVANTINASMPAVSDFNDEQKNEIKNIADALTGAVNPLIIAGPGAGSRSIIEAAANIAFALQQAGKNVSLCYTTPDPNSFGLEMLGGKDLDDAASEISRGNAESVIVIENDLYKALPAEKMKTALQKIKNLVVLDYLENKTTALADILIPVGAFSENDGTLVNNEGRAQRFYQVYPVLAPVKETWRWIKEIAVETGRKDFDKLNSFQDFVNELVREYPQFSGVESLTPPPSFRIAGQKIPRETHRYSGRTAMHANVNIHEQKPADDIDSALTFTMEGYIGKPPSSLIPFFWSPGWNSAQAINKFQSEVNGPLHDGDPGRRLINAAAGAKKFNPFMNVPPAYRAAEGEYMMVPLYHIFGSEELSSLSRPVAQRIPEAYVMMNIDDINKNNFSPDSFAEIKVNDKILRMKVKPGIDMPAGVAALSILAGMDYVELPAAGTITGGAA